MNSKEEFLQIAELLFPNVSENPEDIFKKYPKRNLDEGQYVTRFAPSPTGFLHIGTVFAALVAFKLAKQSNGVYILRIEDTDKNREVDNGVNLLAQGLKDYGICSDEGVISSSEQIGDYGPYMQSERLDIYAVFAKDLVSKGRAYPCFITPEELEEIRKKQEDMGVRTGYYGEWAKWRDASFEDIKKEIEKDSKFVIRLYSNGDGEEEFTFTDLVKGKKSLKKNSIDSVLLKSDGYPVYHFAHPIDDTLMHITNVVRGDEWFASTPLHYEIFQALELDVLPYAHISPLMKIDEEGGKRKLSKRKDPEADTRYYSQQGYPKEGVLEYLINILNSNYQDWKRGNKEKSYDEFKISLEKINRSGALFDFVKLESFCREYIATLSATEVYERVLDWAKEYDEQVFKRLSENKEYCIKIFNIEREGKKIRKDMCKWSDVVGQLDIFFDDLFNSLEIPSMPENISDEDLKNIIEEFISSYDPDDDCNVWFEKVKAISESLGFTSDYNAFKKNPSKFKGKVGDVAMVLRLKTTRKMQTPDLCEIMKVLGKEKVVERLKN